MWLNLLRGNFIVHGNCFKQTFKLSEAPDKKPDKKQGKRNCEQS
jgi:hypothetical protein